MKRLLLSIALLGLAGALLFPFAGRYRTVSVDIGRFPARKPQRDEGAIAAARRLAREINNNPNARTFSIVWRTPVPPNLDYSSCLEYDRINHTLAMKALTADASGQWRTIYTYTHVTDSHLVHLAADGSTVQMLPRYGSIRTS